MSPRATALVVSLAATLLACGDDGTGAGPGAGGSGGAGGDGASGGAGGAAVECEIGTASKQVIPCAGLEYDLSLSDACGASGCGLIVDVHGFTMSGAMEEANTGLAALATPRGYVVLQPNANPDPPGSSWAAATDDQRVVAFVEQVIADLGIDPLRIHFTGFSQGGDMTWRMLCDHGELFASVAPAAFGHGPFEQCFSQGVAPPLVPILYMHGTVDALVPFAEAEAARDRVIAAYALGAPEVVEEDADHLWQRFQGPNGALLEFLQHDYTGVSIIEGHCFPGSDDPSTQPGQLFSYKCDQAAAFHWGEAALAFFEAHPKL